jgi:hypothetical protein
MLLLSPMLLLSRTICSKMERPCQSSLPVLVPCDLVLVALSPVLVLLVLLLPRPACSTAGSSTSEQQPVEPSTGHTASFAACVITACTSTVESVVEY